MTYKSCDKEYHKAADQRPKQYNSTMLRIAIYIAVASLVCPVAMAGGFCKDVPDESCCGCYRSEEEQQEKYDAPMLWIGIYIAAASLVCSIAMAGDLIQGIRQKKLWFPCKLFTMNAASLSVLAAATKLPVDLTTRMDATGSEAKLTSIVLVITIMGNFLTSFASMDSNAILTNTVALGILVITITVNACIQIVTGAIGLGIGVLVGIVLVCMLFLFVTLTFSVLTVPTTKRFLELEYGELHKTISTGEKLEETGMLTNQKLKEVVEKYWVMTETSSSQFVMARSVTSATCGVICMFTTLPLLYSWIRYAWAQGTLVPQNSSNPSSYEWSTSLIFMIQLFGIAVGTVAPACRWFTSISFTCRNLCTDNHYKEFKLVETYWIQRWHYYKKLKRSRSKY